MEEEDGDCVERCSRRAEDEEVPSGVEQLSCFLEVEEEAEWKHEECREEAAEEGEEHDFAPKVDAVHDEGGDD